MKSGYCPKCHTRVTARLEVMQGIVGIPLGMFNDSKNFDGLKLEIWTSQKLPFLKDNGCFAESVEDSSVQEKLMGLLEALGDRRGITRFGEAFVPFDETQVFACVDLSGRPHFEFRVEIPKSKVGDFDVELAEEFFKSLTNTLKCNLHIELKYGDNLHHIIEAMFKAVGRALDKATSLDPRSKDIPSTKGTL